jgi:hypothetical protein
MKTEFQILLTGLFICIAPALFGQSQVQTGTSFGKKEISSKRLVAKGGEPVKGDFKAKPYVREVVRTRQLKKEATKE